MPRMFKLCYLSLYVALLGYESILCEYAAAYSAESQVMSSGHAADMQLTGCLRCERGHCSLLSDRPVLKPAAGSHALSSNPRATSLVNWRVKLSI